MSVLAIASFRPLHGRCLRHATTGILSISVRSRTASIRMQAVVALESPQRRLQSTSSKDGKDSERPLPTSKGSFGRFVGKALGASLRNLVVAVSPRGIRSAYRDSPALTSMNVVLLLVTLLLSAIAVRSYILRFYNSEFSRYPEPVANTLRRAIYYTNYKPDPELALKYYKKAMEQVKDVGLDPFSDEVLGIRIQVSFWLQKIGSYRASIDVLESVLGDCRKWVDAMEQSAKDGKVTAAGFPVMDAPEPVPSTAAGKQVVESSKSPSEKPTEDDGEPETLWRKRQRLLAKAVSTAVKLGELYADEHVLKADKSHEHLKWAVEQSLREFKRRRVDGVKPGEQEWLSRSELGGMLESLGRDYERRSQFQLAIPPLFEALKLCESPCHRAVIMNNLAACFAQHPVDSPDTSELRESIQQVINSPELPRTRNECLEAGMNWAKNAYMHGKDVKGEERTPECDEACAVALCNWGDVAAMLGKTELASGKYRECIEMSTKMEFPAGVEQAREGLARLGSNAKK